jgi:transposase
MGRPSKYPRELRERAVRMVAEMRPDYPSEYAAISAVAQMLGIGSPETIRTWLRRVQVDTGQRPGVTTEAQAEIKRLSRENAELRRANEILKAASAFFAAELDRPQKRS